MTIIPEDSKLAQTRTIKELSQILRIKKNLVALRKRIRRKTSTAEVTLKQYFDNFNHNLVFSFRMSQSDSSVLFRNSFCTSSTATSRSRWRSTSSLRNIQRRRRRWERTMREGGRHSKKRRTWLWSRIMGSDSTRITGLLRIFLTFLVLPTSLRKSFSRKDLLRSTMKIWWTQEITLILQCLTRTSPAMFSTVKLDSDVPQNIGK